MTTRRMHVLLGGAPQAARIPPALQKNPLYNPRVAENDFIDAKEIFSACRHSHGQRIRLGNDATLRGDIG